MIKGSHNQLFSSWLWLAGQAVLEHHWPATLTAVAVVARVALRAGREQRNDRSKSNLQSL
jgi:hypothetical protein